MNIIRKIAGGFALVAIVFIIGAGIYTSTNTDIIPFNDCSKERDISVKAFSSSRHLTPAYVLANPSYELANRFLESVRMSSLNMSVDEAINREGYFLHTIAEELQKEPTCWAGEDIKNIAIRLGQPHLGHIFNGYSDELLSKEIVTNNVIVAHQEFVQNNSLIFASDLIGDAVFNFAMLLDWVFK